MHNMVITAKTVLNLNDDQRRRFLAFLTNSIGRESSENEKINEFLLDSWGVIRIFLLENSADMVLATALLASNDVSTGHISVIGLCYDAEFPGSGRQVLESVVATRNERFPNHCLSAEIARGNAWMHSVMHDLGFTAESGESGADDDWITFTLAAGDANGTRASILLEESVSEIASTTHVAGNSSSKQTQVPVMKATTVESLKCLVCGDNLSSIRNLRRHIENVHNSKEHPICAICQKQFNDESLLISHKKLVHSLMQCEQCDKMYRTTGRLIRHVSKIHGEKTPKSFKCEFCSGQFKSQRLLTEHSKVHQKIGARRKVKELMCVLCNRSFQSQSRLIDHARLVHEKIKSFECKLCKKPFGSEYGLNDHIKYGHEKVRDFECDSCHKLFTKQSILNNHVKCVHQNINELECKVCNKLFARKAGLARHIKYVHGKQLRKFECELCQNSFKMKDTLREHIKYVHEKVKNFKCDVCGKLFVRKVSLKNHIRSAHEKMNGFDCNVCRKQFSGNTRLQLHITRCHNVCPKSFGNEPDLKNHANVHESIKKVQKF
eukprot:216696_1